MTLTLEITPEIEHALADKARRAGVALPDYVARVLEREAVTTTEPPRRHAAAFGKFAGMGVSVESALAAKREEIELEARRG